jgi:hypothetical protein
MGRIYYVTYNGTITNAGGDTDLLEITPADDKPVRLRGMIFSQSSEVGDAAEEGLRITVKRLPATFTSGSGGSSVTPIPCDSADVAAGAACECNNTTVATTSSTAVTLFDAAWNVRNSPFDYWFPSAEFSPKVKGAEGMVVRLETTAADDLTGSFTFCIEEE